MTKKSDMQNMYLSVDLIFQSLIFYGFLYTNALMFIPAPTDAKRL